MINKDNKIMEIKFLDDENKILVKDTNVTMRIIKDPRDLLNKTIGYLFVESIAGIRHRSGLNFEFYYNCRCISEDNGQVCNNMIIRGRNFLIQNMDNPELSCGCRRYKYLETDIIGNTYNDLTVIAFDHWEYNSEPARKERYKARDYFYICECKHGRRQIAKRDDLISYHIKGCQCTYVDHTDEIPDFKACYHDMITRCYNPNSKHYPNYGGRGIKVCDRWKESFLNFKEDMYASFVSHYETHNGNTTIERIDVNKDYEPSNCKWITKADQAYNKRTTHYYYYNGSKLTLGDLMKYYFDPGMTYENCRSRLRSKSYCINDTIIDPNIFINSNYRIELQSKNAIIPIRFIDEEKKEYYKSLNLPTTFEMKPYKKE